MTGPTSGRVVATSFARLRRRRFQGRLASSAAATVAWLLLACGNASAACNSTANGGSDAPLAVTVATHMNLGRFTRPDTGTGFLTVSPQGVRSLPPNLRIPSDNNTAFISAAQLTVTGGPGCWFQVSVTPVTGDYVSFVAVDGGGSPLASGGKAQLNTGTGTLTLLIGLTLPVPYTGGTLVPGSFEVQVTYTDP